MSKIIYKASELRRPLKLMLPTSESKKSNYAKKVYVSITENKDEMGLLLQTRQVGFMLSLFKGVVQSELQHEEQTFDIVTGTVIVKVDSKELDCALASFGTQSIVMELHDDGCISIANEQNSQVVVKGVPSSYTAQDVMAAWADDADIMGACSVKVPVDKLATALMPATKITVMPGNNSDMKGVHLHMHRDEHTRQHTLQVVGAHTQAMFVDEIPLGDTTDDVRPISCTIMPDAATRLREALLSEIDHVEEGGGLQSVMMMETSDGELGVYCGDWAMQLNLQEICRADCTERLGMPGKNVFEMDRVRLMQALSGLKLMGESEAYLSFADSEVVIEGESQAHKGERTMVVACQRYGAGEELTRHKYPISPLVTMLSAACAAQNNKTVKLMTDADDKTVCVQCEEFNVFVV